MSNAPQRQPARDDLCRSVAFRAAQTDEPNDGFTLDGYGAVFNSPTRIDSWEGKFDERIAPGAFKKSLRENTPKMQFDHGQHPLIGSIPIGRFDTVEEDSHGLHVVGRLSDNWLIEPVRNAIADGGIDGMSFRFSVVRDAWETQEGKAIRNDAELWDCLMSRDDADTPIRTLKEVRVSEVGPVAWPAYADTSVGVRSKSFVVDLSSRSSLAHAAFVIDAAVRNTGDVVEVEEAEDNTNDAPPSTDVDAVRHSEEPPDTSSDAGEHSSDPDALNKRDRAARIRARNRENARILSSITTGGADDAR